MRLHTYLPRPPPTTATGAGAADDDDSESDGDGNIDLAIAGTYTDVGSDSDTDDASVATVDDDHEGSAQLRAHRATSGQASAGWAQSSQQQQQQITTTAAAAGGGGNTAVIPLCTDMCPAVLRQKYLTDQSEDKFEKCVPGLKIPGLVGSVPPATAASSGMHYTPADLMVKRLIKSSADHSIQIPHQIRTPATLLRTIRYLEEHVMDAGSCAYAWKVCVYVCSICVV